MKDLWFDLETYCERPIKNGSYQYAEAAEVMLWAYADGDAEPRVWDLVNNTISYIDDLSGAWVEEVCGAIPEDLAAMLTKSEYLCWGHNAGQFDFPVLDRALPTIGNLIAPQRRRDTMVQAFAHALPGALDKLGEILNLNEDKRKIKEGKKLIHLFCKPQSDAFFEKHGTRRATKQTHPAEWQRFIEYAGGDIVTMREAHRLMPMWNYKGKQVDLCLLDWKINNRGFAVDVELAEAAVRVSDEAKRRLAKQTRELTDGEVQATTQRDALLKHILEIHGVELPDMQADTLERRMQDPDLPDAVRELLGNRLQASMNSVSKFKTLLRGVSSDGRLRGCMQFRGAGRTGRRAHRLFQPGNLPRPALPHELIDFAIDQMKLDALDAIELGAGSPMVAISSSIRGAIVAPPGRKLVVADLANIEGRAAAWLAGEDWKLQAFRDFDTILFGDDGKPLLDKKGKPQRKGVDLYIKAYMASFNVIDAALVDKDMRQIGKVEELMFQYGGGVGAWITGAATYGIDLDKMTEQVYDTLPEWAVLEARNFLDWLYEQCDERLKEALKKLAAREAQGPDAPDFAPIPTAEQWAEECAREQTALTEKWKSEKDKARHGLPEKTFVACDAIKRLWRRAHPMISSYWKELEDTVRQAINTPAVTFPCRKVKIRRDGAWLRIGLPSGRALCYPNPKIEKDGSITYTGLNQYTRQWGRVSTYGGKVFENITQAAAADQLMESEPLAEDAGYEIGLDIHDEIVAETPDDPRFNADELGRLMCADLGWNAGLPLAAAGFETPRYRKE